MKGPETRLFGVALDPSDDPLSLEMKRAWMLRETAANGERYPPRDPYDSLVRECPELLTHLSIEPTGKFPVPSWLWPRPRPTDLPKVTAARIGDYYDSGHFERLIKRLRGFVEKRIFPARPLMLGIDHSASAAVISALSHHYGNDKISVVALDQHFDAIPQSVRLKESAAARGALAGAAGGDHLCCGNFWSWLLKENAILPENLSLMGVADYPRAVGSSSLGGEFCRYYLDFAKAGARFFPLDRFLRQEKEGLLEFLDGALKTPLVYLSLDLDVASFKGVMAARYMDRPGITAGQLLRCAKELAGAIKRKKVELVGLDIMEFNQHFLGLAAEGGIKDQTMELAARYLETVLNLGRASRGS
jgi:arginase family enzyme